MIEDRDLLFRRALATPPSVEAPIDLADEILRTISATPQRRSLFGLGRLPMWRPSPLVAGVALLVLLALALVIVALGQSRPPAHRLAMYHGGPARTGVMVGPGPVGSPGIAWSVARPGPFAFSTMPLVADDRVFVADGSGVVAALQATTGRVIWESPQGSAIRGTPVLAAGLVVFGTDAGEVVAVHAADGARAWTLPLGAAPVATSLLEADGRIYLGTGNGTIAAIDAASGVVIWTTGTSGAVTRGVALKSGVLYVGASDGSFAAIDAATGHLRWRVQLGPGDVGTPIVGEQLVYVARGLLAPDGAHDVVAMDPRDGSIRWSYATPTGRQAFAAGLAEGALYVVSEDANVYSLDATAGTLRWRASAGGPIGTLAAIVGPVVYITSSDRTVRALDAATGKEQWLVPVTGNPTMAAVVDGRVFVATSVGQVVAIGATGTPAAASR